MGLRKPLAGRLLGMAFLLHGISQKLRATKFKLDAAEFKFRALEFLRKTGWRFLFEIQMFTKAWKFAENGAECNGKRRPFFADGVPYLRQATRGVFPYQ